MIEREQFSHAEAQMDTSVLRKLLTLLGPDGPALLRGIVETYLIENPPVVEGLGEALARSDYVRATALAHRLMGSSLSIGASSLAARCNALEATCNAELTPPAAAYAAIVADFTATRQVLRALLKDLA
ncbi:MAG: Hpt domain-containing protein [Chloroflexales bacterium]